MPLQKDVVSPTPNVVDLAMDLLIFKLANIGENQPKTNFKTRISAIATVSSEKCKICQTDCFAAPIYLIIS